MHRLLLASVFIALLGSGTAWSNPPSPQPLPAMPLAVDMTVPKETRRITAKSATSTCIGDPRTPLCAAETFLACVARQAPQLCERVAVEWRSGFAEEPREEVYRVRSIKRERLQDFSKDARRDLELYGVRPGIVAPGDVMVSLWLRQSEPICEKQHWCFYDVYARRMDGGWQIISWFGELYGETEPFAK
jgi:hypothetical protein